MISLARQLAIRQEVAAMFSDDGEASSMRADYEDRLYRYGAASSANYALEVAGTKPRPKNAPTPKPVRLCATAGCSEHVRWKRVRCVVHANEHRLAMTRARTARLYAAISAEGRCLACRKPLGAEENKWRHKACEKRLRGVKHG